MKNICNNFSSRPTGFSSRFCWIDSAFSFSPVITSQLFFQSPSSDTLCSYLEILFTTNNLLIFWRSKFQQVSTYAFCSSDELFRQNWNCSSPNTLRTCTKSPSTLSTDISLKRISTFPKATFFKFRKECRKFF